MENYDEIIGFDYASRDEWRKWIEKKFLYLHKLFSLVLELRKELEDIFKTNFEKALEQQNMKKILLGGMTRDGKYTSNSLAKFYKEILGISVNLNAWVSYCREGLDPRKYVKCEFENTFFLKFVGEMKQLVEKILYRVGIEPEVKRGEVEEILNTPEKLLEVAREICRSIISISANYDYHMFFILNVCSIPRFYIEKAYPKLREKFEEVANILELEEKFVPNVDDDKVKRDCTIVGHKKNGISSLLFNFTRKIWEYCGELSWKYILETVGIDTKIINLKNEFKEKTKQMLEKMGWEEPEYVGIGWTYYVDGIVITRYSFCIHYHRYEGKCNISLLQLLRDISPAVFLNYYWLEVDRNSIKIVKED